MSRVQLSPWWSQRDHAACPASGLMLLNIERLNEPWVVYCQGCNSIRHQGPDVGTAYDILAFMTGPLRFCDPTAEWRTP